MQIAKQHQLMLLSIFALLASSLPTNSWGFSYGTYSFNGCECVEWNILGICTLEKCCNRNNVPLRWAEETVTMNIVRSDFPEGSADSDAVSDTITRWNSVSDFNIIGASLETNTPQLNNGVSELWRADLGDTLGRTTTYLSPGDINTCSQHIVETDLRINNNLSAPPWHPLEDARHAPYTPFHASPPSNTIFPRYPLHEVLMHELGHVVGLNHHSTVYSIMGAGFETGYRNENGSYFGPSGDGAAGARYLYGGAGEFDVGVTIWQLTGIAQVGNQINYSVHDAVDWVGDVTPDTFVTKDTPREFLPLCGDDYNFVKRYATFNGVRCFDVDAGSDIEVPFTYENMASTPEDIEVSIILSDDLIVGDTDDRLLTTGTIYSLQNHRTSLAPVRIPSDLKASDRYYLIANISAVGKEVYLEYTDENNTAWYPFIIRNGNLPPAPLASFGLSDIPLAVTWNRGIEFTLLADDPNGDTVTFQIESDPANGSITLLNDNGRFLYYPDPDFSGSDSFEYQLSDPYGGSYIDIFHIEVVRPSHDVITTKTGSGAGTISSNPHGIDCGATCIDEFAAESIITLKAQPDPNSLFLGWDGSCSSSGTSQTCTLTVNGAEIVIARFEPAPSHYFLTTSKIGSGSGTVLSDPLGIDCGADCEESYAAGADTEVTLIAEPDSGSVFRGWNGSCTGTRECEVKMYRDHDIVATFSTANPTQFFVSNLADTGAGSLRQAIIDANGNPGEDVIAILNSVTGTIILETGEIDILDSVIIKGPGADRLAVSGNLSSRIFRLDPGLQGTITISGLTIKDGLDEAGNGGGGILVDSGTISIVDSAINDNSSISGSGGGGIRKFGPGAVTIERSTISGNSALDEYDQGDGGAIRNDQGNFTLINSTVSNNHAASGGGITTNQGWFEVSNSTITGNTALYGGGGISGTSQIVISNTLVIGNTASFEEEISYFSLNPSEVFLSRGNNILGENGVASITSEVILTANDQILEGLISSAIEPLGMNGGPTKTHQPVIGGPAIDNGNNALIAPGVDTDQRGSGYPRSIAVVDIGAVEISAEITGSVTDPGGTPLNNISVEILAEDDTGWVPTSYAYTNESGVYTFTGLAPGSYRVCFTDSYESRYIAECYEDASDVTFAQDIIVQSGSKVSGLNSELGFVNDIDRDGVENDFDNCSEISNTDQNDENGNFIGDACDLADSDSDSMPDNYEYRLGLPVGTYDGTRDDDGDGVSNIDEYAAGTNPVLMCGDISDDTYVQIDDVILSLQILTGSEVALNLGGICNDNLRIEMGETLHILKEISNN